MTVADTTAAPNGVSESPASDLDISRDDLLAGLDELDTESEGEAAPAESDDETEGDAEESDEESEDESEEESEDEESDDEAEEEGEEEAEPDKGDDETAKRIEAIQQAEKRSREQAERFFAEERAKLEKEWGPKVERAKEVDALLDRASVDPAALAGHLKWDVDQKLYAAKQLYQAAMAEKEPGNPKYRETAAQMRAQREVTSKTSTLEKQLAEMREELAQQKAEREFDGFVSKAQAAIKEAPLVAKLMENSPDTARNHLRIIADWQKQNGSVNAAEAIKILEDQQREHLKALGVEVPDKAGKTAKPKKKAQEAGEKKTAKKSSKKQPPQPPQDAPPPTRDQLIKELEELEN